MDVVIHTAAMDAALERIADHYPDAVVAGHVHGRPLIRFGQAGAPVKRMDANGRTYLVRA